MQTVRCPLFPDAKQKLLIQGVAQKRNLRPSASTMYRRRLQCRTRRLLATLHALSKPTDDIPTYKFPLVLHGSCIPAEADKARIACFIHSAFVCSTLVEHADTACYHAHLVFQSCFVLTLVRSVSSCTLRRTCLSVRCLELRRAHLLVCRFCFGDVTTT